MVNSFKLYLDKEIFKFKINSVKKIYKIYPTRWSVTEHVTCFNYTPNKCSIQCKAPIRVGLMTQSNKEFLTHYLIEQVNNVLFNCGLVFVQVYNVLSVYIFAQ